MIITEQNGLYKKTTEYEYKPTTGELYHYYSGTHAGINCDNPYTKKYGMSIKKIRYIKE